MAIRTINEVCEFFTMLIKDDKLSLHPDTPFEDYQDIYNGMPVYNEREANHFNSKMEDCFEVCTVFGIDIYGLALAVTNGVAFHKWLDNKEIIYDKIKMGNFLLDQDISFENGGLPTIHALHVYERDCYIEERIKGEYWLTIANMSYHGTLRKMESILFNWYWEN